MFAVIHHKQPMNLLTNINKSWHLKAASSMSSKTTSSQHQKCQARFQKHIYNTVLPCLQQPGNCSITFVLKNSVIKSQLTRVPYTTTPGLQFSALPLVAFFFWFFWCICIEFIIQQRQGSHEIQGPFLLLHLDFSQGLLAHTGMSHLILWFTTLENCGTKSHIWSIHRIITNLLPQRQNANNKQIRKLLKTDDITFQ